MLCEKNANNFFPIFSGYSDGKPWRNNLQMNQKYTVFVKKDYEPTGQEVDGYSSVINASVTSRAGLNKCAAYPTGKIV